MKAAVVDFLGKPPIYREFEQPVAEDNEILVNVTAAALSQVTRARAAGKHYSSPTNVPFVVGIDGVGRRGGDAKRTYFFMPRAPFGSMAQHSVALKSLCVPLPDEIDDVTAAAIAIPAMSSWASFKARARLVRGEVVLINGATGASGRLAVQVAKHLGAGKLIVTGRNREVLDALGALGADVAISLAQDDDSLEETFRRHFRDGGVDIILDYLWGRSAEKLLAAAAKERIQRPLRFVQLGSASAIEIALSYAVLRSCPIEMMGCGLGSVSLTLIMNSIAEVLAAAVTGGFSIPIRAVPLKEIESHWAGDGLAARTVFLADGT
jgi:NADPH:quinone reductase-like Zn-dependent oxidoreductase